MTTVGTGPGPATQPGAVMERAAEPFALVDSPATPVEVVRVPTATEPLATAAPPRVSLVIPAKNEARNLSWVLSQIPSCVDEVILVDGQSTDATLTMARSCRPDIRIVDEPRPGKGWALQAGFNVARGELVVMIDADGSMSPEEIPHYLYFLENGYDFVKGSRFMAGGGSLDISRLRRLGARGLVTLVNVLSSSQLTDLCYGFCAFRRCYLDHLALSSSGFEIETEMVIGAIRAGLRIAEVPSLELPRRSGRSNLRTFRDGGRVVRTVLRKRRRTPQAVRPALPASEPATPLVPLGAGMGWGAGSGAGGAS